MRVSRSRRTTVIRRIAVRETSVSRHHGEKIKGPPETSSESQHYRIEVFKRGPQLGLHRAERRQPGL